ncbi:hypothetical protein NECAME_08423 [Necator americanus]|uniref:Ctg-1-like C-terminal domain-containing protein n=1 Tax=Necator americanus TaxID=51031 RepID=W2TKM3_NECAM|nr:hypothetical protein NECAME_08423 [Necator americanus]ETN81567.1 hypothetical protein NECAME_08423 [Necator americanus]
MYEGNVGLPGPTLRFSLGERLNIPFDPIPVELYWTPDEKAPSLTELNCAVIPAGKAKTITYVVNSSDPTFIVINRFCDRTFGMGIWYHDNMAAVDYMLDGMSGKSLPQYKYVRVKQRKESLWSDP